MPRSDGAIFRPELREFGVQAVPSHPGPLATGGPHTAAHLQWCPTASLQARP